MADSEKEPTYQEIRVGLPMDVSLFGEFAAVIAGRWPGTRVRGGPGGFVLMIPEDEQ